MRRPVTVLSHVRGGLRQVKDFPLPSPKVSIDILDLFRLPNLYEHYVSKSSSFFQGSDMGLLKATSIICLLGLLVRWVPNASAKVCQVFTTKVFSKSIFDTHLVITITKPHGEGEAAVVLQRN